MYKNFTVIDSHCHIYPEKIASKAVGGTDRFYDIVSKCEGTIDDLIARGKKAGVDHFIVQSVATTPQQVRKINEFIAQSVQEHKGLLTGLGTLHPDSEDQKGDVEHLISLGLQGVKLHPDIQQFAIDDERCLRIYDLCQEKGLPILMHTGDNRYDFSKPIRLFNMAKKYDKVKFIGAHFGGYRCWEEVDVYKGLENVYFDTSSSLNFIDKNKAVEIIKKLGAERFFYGTDFPMWDAVSELERFMALDLSSKQKQDILANNIKNLLSIK